MKERLQRQAFCDAVKIGDSAIEVRFSVRQRTVAMLSTHYDEAV